MDSQQLAETLRLHAMWQRGEHGGDCADLSGANLSRADLSGANLSRADLSGANLRRADLSRANLSRANLRRADLSGANLIKADLYGANLSEANLYVADLSGADLRRANLSGANLRRADLIGANLYVAYLYGADLRRANLREADLRRANLGGAKVHGAGLPGFRLPAGDLIVWKKLAFGHLARLRIPACAKRVSTPIGRKCRAQFAFVEHIEDENGKPVRRCGGHRDPSFTYRRGKWVFPHEFSADWRIECAPGIHFFLTKEEAREY